MQKKILEWHLRCSFESKYTLKESTKVGQEIIHISFSVKVGTKVLEPSLVEINGQDRENNGKRFSTILVKKTDIVGQKTKGYKECYN